MEPDNIISPRPLSHSIDSAISATNKGIADAIERGDHRSRSQLLGVLASLQLRKAEAERTEKAEKAQVIFEGKSGRVCTIEYLDSCLAAAEEESELKPPATIFRYGVLYRREKQ